MDGRTRWNQYNPPFNFVEARGITIPATIYKDMKKYMLINNSHENFMQEWLIMEMQAFPINFLI